MPAVHNLIGTFIGGIFLAVFFFLSREYVFCLPDLNGPWTFQSETEVTLYNPYKGIKVTYIVLLWQEGNRIHGSGEKVQDEIKDGSIRKYTGSDRSRIEIRGYVTKRYLRKSKVVLHFAELSEKRVSTTMQSLLIPDKKTMEGKYASTIANSSGKVRWTRGTDDLAFENPPNAAR